MEIVVIPTKTEKAGLKLDNLLDKLNTRIIEKVDECNDLLDKIQLSSEKELKRRKFYETIDKERQHSLANEAIDMNMELVKNTHGNYRFTEISFDRDGYAYCELIGPYIKTEPLHPYCNEYGRMHYSLNQFAYKLKDLKKIAKDLTDEYNKREFGTGDRELSENDTKVSA